MEDISSWGDSLGYGNQGKCLGAVDDDEREIELSALCAIFPEIVMDAEDPFTAFIDLPVMPLAPLQISLPGETIPGTAAPSSVNTHNLEYLPPLHVKFSLPLGYPKSEPPNFELSISPAWLPQEKLVSLKAEGERLWEDLGHDQVLFAFIDMLQDSATNGFGIKETGEELSVSQSDKIALLDFNIKAKKEAFNKETFECGICLDPKKGSVCHRMLACGHVFCVQCLQDFYNNAITTGDLSTVRCLAPGCAKEQEAKSEKPRKSKTFISPSELLQIPLGHYMVERYVTLKHKAQLESDKNTVYCPRSWCQGGARSKKHRKPEGLEIVDEVDSDSESEGASNNKKSFTSRAELMRICEDCSFAFCSRCFQGWHGEYFHCLPRNTDGELTEEDKASLEYVRLHTTPCPSCSCPAQKTHGCNHMICFKCNTHFCYLCSAWLPPDNPYKHFNVQTQACYMRLWELEGGDGDDVGIGFGGGDRVLPGDFENENHDEDEVDDAAARIVPEPPAGERQPQAPIPIVPVAPRVARHIREGPLVIRLDLPAPAPLPAPPRAPPPAPPRRHLAIDRRGDAPARRNRRRNAGQGQRNQPLVEGNALPIPQRLARRPNFARILARDPVQQQLQREANILIRDARRILQDVHQRNPQVNPGIGQLLQRPLPAHDNMNDAELLQQREWLERFIELAVNDEEDDWDSDEDDGDDHMWEIPPR